MSESGADEDLALFCQREYPGLVGALSFYCGDRYVAEEIAQEALARGCRDWRRLRAMEHPGAWVRRVAFNLAKSRRRRSFAERRATERVAGRSRVAHQVPDEASAVSVRQAVAALPHRQKAVLILHYFEDLTFAEVATVLEWPEGTVKSLAHRAIERLRRDSGLLNDKEAAHVE